MAVMVSVFACGPSHFRNWDDAAFEFRAAYVFELDGGVGNLEMLHEDMVELDQDAGALRRRNVVNADMAGEGAGL
jgi:hypothetical protein